MSIGKLLILVGGILMIFGFVVSYAPGLISWFGHLPGDIRIEDENIGGLYTGHIHDCGQYFNQPCDSSVFVLEVI